MKKSIYLFIGFCLSVFASTAQLNYTIIAVDQGGSSIPNQMIFEFIPGTSSTAILGYTDINGELNFTDSNQVVKHILTYDCNGMAYLDSIFATPFFPHDTAQFYLACGSDLGCSMDLYSSQSVSGSVFLIDSGLVPNSLLDFSYTWDMGDGTTLFNTTGYVQHTYNSFGTYSWSVTRSLYDSINNFILCSDVKFGNFVIGSNPSICNAEYLVDTNNSVLATAILWNTSTPAANDPNYTTTYYWDFGDGNSSTQPFPIHTYTNIGMYGVCLTIYTTNGVDSCTSTYCDSLGMDSNGNLIYKGATGFTLKVLDPNSISLDENELRNVVLMPNPANDWITLSSLTVEGFGTINYTLMDLSGRILERGEMQRQAETRLNVSELPNGMYLLSVEDSKQSKTMKLQIAH